MLYVMQLLVCVRLGMSGVHRGEGCASAVSLVYVVGLCLVVCGICLMRIVLFGFFLFRVLFRAVGGRGYGW